MKEYVLGRSPCSPYEGNISNLSGMKGYFPVRFVWFWLSFFGNKEHVCIQLFQFRCVTHSFLDLVWFLWKGNGGKCKSGGGWVFGRLGIRRLFWIDLEVYYGEVFLGKTKVVVRIEWVEGVNSVYWFIIGR